MAAIIPPTVLELSALMRARTRGEFSDQGVFNAETRPTDVEAQAMIDLAASVVTPKVSDDVPAKLVAAVTAAIKFKAATLVEATYYPEQANADNSAYALWQAQYEELIAVLKDADPGADVVVPGFGVLPTFGRDGGPYDPAALPVDPWV